MIDHLDIDKNQPIISVVELNRAIKKTACMIQTITGSPSVY